MHGCTHGLADEPTYRGDTVATAGTTTAAAVAAAANIYIILCGFGLPVGCQPAAGSHSGRRE